MNTSNGRRKYWERKKNRNLFTNARDAGYKRQKGKLSEFRTSNTQATR